MMPSWFDWRRSLIVLARSWPLILAATLLVAMLAASYRLFIAPNVYEAEALVLVSRPRYQIELESKIKSNQEPLAGAASNIASLRARLDTLAVLARSTEVERAVQQRLAGDLNADDQRPGQLMNRIRVRPANELLRISASASDPALAASLANAWAEQVAARVEAVYSSSAGMQAMEAEVQKAHTAYQEADRAVSRFALDHPIDDLTRRVHAKSQEVQLLQALQEQRIGYLRSRALSIHRSITEIDQVVRDAESLRSQIGPTTRSLAAGSGDGLALMMLRARMYMSPIFSPPASDFSRSESPAQPAQPAAGDSRSGAQRPADNRPNPAPTVPQGTSLQIAPLTSAVSADRSEDRVADLDGMITALRERRDELQTEFQTLAQRLESGQDPASVLALPADDPTEAALRAAQTELHQAQDEQTELTRQRDELSRQRTLLATSYETLLNKAQEMRVLRATDDSGGVTVAERAVPARGPSGPGPLRYGLIGAVLGFLIGCALALSPLVRDGLRNFASSSARRVSAPDDDRAAGVAAS
jgi:uncharacterized protein involved in exopolysaccharide biosynthesis